MDFWALELGARVVFGEQTLEHLASGGGAEGIADAVVLGEGLDFVEAVLQVEVLPTVGVANREVQLDMQAAQLDQVVKTSSGGAVLYSRLC